MSRPRLLTFQSAKKIPLPSLEDRSDKNERGRVLVVGGSKSVPGAPLLTAEAAMRVGAGKVQIAVPADAMQSVGLAFPECGVLAQSGKGWLKAFRKAVHEADAVVVGPGLTEEAAARKLLNVVLAAARKPVLVDALALKPLWESRKRRNKVSYVLTPHHGEMANMLGVRVEEIEVEPLRWAKQVSEELRSVVVLKGETTHIVSKDASWEHRGGRIGLAVSGSGDVLAGIIAGLIAMGMEPPSASALGVALHAEAGKKLSRNVANVGFLARELTLGLPSLLWK